MLLKRIRSLVVICFILTIGSAAFGTPIYCFDIFNNSVYENDARLNFTVTVTEEGFYKNHVLVGFEFQNNSDLLQAGSSSITDIYFDDDPDKNLLYRKKSLLESNGVSFSDGARPKRLPSGNKLNPKFDKKPEYSTDSDSPVSKNGINPGEWLKVVYKLQSGKTYQDVIDALAAGGTNAPNLRIGIHIQSLPDPIKNTRCYSDSASAINCPNPIPEPATVAILVSGIFLLKKKRN